jgi:glycosyltransferase involved in cell wall biosynthesis
MRILFLNSEAELYNNGGDKILLLTVEALAAEHEVEVLLPLDGPLVAAIRALDVPCEVVPYAIMRRRTLNPLVALTFFVQLVLSTFRIWRYVRKHRIDVVYSNSLGVLQGCLMRLAGGPTNIWHIHDMIDSPRVVNRVYSWLVAHGADIGICVSGAVRDHMATGKDNLRVVWNGIPPIVATPVFGRQTDPPTIGVIGRFNRLKGQAEMVKAAAVMRDSGAEFRVRMVGGTYRGDDSVLRHAEGLIAELELGDLVTIEGAVTDVGAVYRRCDLVVVPSILLDPFPTVALEAMSAGKPVVAYASGGLPEMLGHDSECVAPRGDSAALAGLIRPFLEDEEFRLAKARHQHDRYLEHFTLADYRDRIRQVVRSELLTSGRSR